MLQKLPSIKECYYYNHEQLYTALEETASGHNKFRI